MNSEKNLKQIEKKNIERWFHMNNFDENQDYAEKVLQKFGLSKYHFAYDKYGNLSLLIEHNLKKYKIIVDEVDLDLKIYRCDVHNNFEKHTKENLVLKKKFHDDCIYNSIKWIYNNSKM